MNSEAARPREREALAEAERDTERDRERDITETERETERDTHGVIPASSAPIFWNLRSICQLSIKPLSKIFPAGLAIELSKTF